VILALVVLLVHVYLFSITLRHLRFHRAVRAASLLRVPRSPRLFESRGVPVDERIVIHHQLDVHAYNYGDIPFWDRLFGT